VYVSNFHPSISIRTVAHSLIHQRLLLARAQKRETSIIPIKPGSHSSQALRVVVQTMQRVAVFTTAMLSYYLCAAAVVLADPVSSHQVGRSFLRELNANTDTTPHVRRELKSILSDIVPSPREMIELGIVLLIFLFLYKKYKESGVGR
jgi:hypothetical protein